MKIDRFNPRDKSETKDLCKYYCMPTDKNGFIIWKDPQIPLDIKKYIEMLKPEFKAKNGRDISHDDVLTICQLRYMAARSSLRNAEENSDKMGNYNKDYRSLSQIKDECESLYKATKQDLARIRKEQNESFLSEFLV